MALLSFAPDPWCQILNSAIQRLISAHENWRDDDLDAGNDDKNHLASSFWTTSGTLARLVSGQRASEMLVLNEEEGGGVGKQSETRESTNKLEEEGE